MRHVTHKWVMSNLNESCHIWMGHVTHASVMSHLNECTVVSFHIHLISSRYYHIWESNFWKFKFSRATSWVCLVTFRKRFIVSHVDRRERTLHIHFAKHFAKLRFVCEMLPGRPDTSPDIEKGAEMCEFDGKEPLFIERTIAFSIRVLGWR